MFAGNVVVSMLTHDHASNSISHQVAGSTFCKSVARNASAVSKLATAALILHLYTVLSFLYYEVNHKCFL